MSTRQANTKTTIDPVCGMEVDSDVTAIRSTFDGKTYYFCAEGYRLSFEKEPWKYLVPKRKGIWGRYGSIEEINRR